MESSDNLFFQNEVPQTNQEVPQEICKWNWGAFIFNIFWGIGNKTYLPLLCLIPLLNIVWPFVCGAKGNEWAWKNGHYSNPKEFLLVQSTWSRAGFAAFIYICIILGIELLCFCLIIPFIMGSLSYR